MPTPKWKRVKLKALKQHFAQILRVLGYDLNDKNFVGTPERAAKLWFEELYLAPATKALFQTFPEHYDQMVVLTGHTTYTRCPHHLERVRFIVSVGYIPNMHVLGLSKLARIADYYAKGLVLQETYTDMLAEGLAQALRAQGVGVYVSGEHNCMQARGVKTSGRVVTTALKGSFLNDAKTREEFLRCVTKGGIT